MSDTIVKEFNKNYGQLNDRLIKAVNWNDENEVALALWNQNIQQFWTEEEIDLSDDVNTWKVLGSSHNGKAKQKAFLRVLGGLTQLDTLQGGMGMPLISVHCDDMHFKGVFMFMGAMEEIHAKSYSNIFTSLANTDKISETFQWVEDNELVQRKANMIDNYYRQLLTPEPTLKQKYMAKVASVFLESFLFYSGFFYPLYLAGGGEGNSKYLLVGSSEIIKLISRDEAVHGIATGYVAQQEYARLSLQEQLDVDKETYTLLADLYEIEEQYTASIYDEIGLTEQVLSYVRFNANRALMNLGKEEFFEEDDVNPIVMNGISTQTSNHDFFSSKGNGYVKNKNRHPITSEDFVFDFGNDPDHIDLDDLPEDY